MKIRNQKLKVLQSRRDVLASLIALGLVACSPHQLISRKKKSDKPNVLMICIDDLNDWVGCLNSNPNAKTPNIDRLANSGTLFTNAHAQAPLCGPSRASLLTGLLPSTTGIYGHISDNDIRAGNLSNHMISFLPEQFSKVGYHTMGIGKIFHNSAPDGVFQEFGGRQGGFGPKPPSRFHWQRTGTSTDWGDYPKSDNHMPDYRTANWTAERLGKSYDKPFFMAVGFVRPHVPWYVPKKWFDLHPMEDIVLPEFLEGDLQDVPDIAKLITEIPVMPPKSWVDKNNQWGKIIQAYSASVSFVDHYVGVVLDALNNGPNHQNTIVLLWSDHGYHLGEKGLFQKFTLWERSTRVPLIFSGPGIVPQQNRSEPVGLIDIYPTLLDVMGHQGSVTGAGRTLMPMLEGGQPENRPYTITTLGKGNHAIRTNRYRYIIYSDGAEELYDHEVDPNEWNNIAHEREFQKVIEDLRQYLPVNEANWSPQSKIGISPYFNRNSLLSR